MDTMEIVYIHKKNNFTSIYFYDEFILVVCVCLCVRVISKKGLTYINTVHSHCFSLILHILRLYNLSKKFLTLYRSLRWTLDRWN